MTAPVSLCAPSSQTLHTLLVRPAPVALISGSRLLYPNLKFDSNPRKERLLNVNGAFQNLVF